MSNVKKQSKTLSVLLWISKVTLAVSLVGGAFIKLFMSPEELSEMFPWTLENRELLMITAFIDFILGIGFILPSMNHHASKLNVISAYGTIVLMIAASIFHISRGESSEIGINILFLLLALFIIWGKQKQLKGE